MLMLSFVSRVATPLHLSIKKNFIIATQGKGARIGNIVSAELRPYDVARILIKGPDILLPQNWP